MFIVTEYAALRLSVGHKINYSYRTIVVLNIRYGDVVQKFPQLNVSSNQ